MNRIWTGTLKVMFTLWYRIRRSFSCYSMNRIRTGTLKVMFTPWYRILRSFSCPSMNRVWTATAWDRSKSFTHIESFNLGGKILQIANWRKNRAILHSSIKGAVSRNLWKFKRRELRPNQVKYENNCSNIKSESFCRSRTWYVFASNGWRARVKYGYLTRTASRSHIVKPGQTRTTHNCITQSH